ncbi:MAG: prephenate dehydrogenase [Gemmatimonadaceae bacterium]
MSDIEERLTFRTAGVIGLGLIGGSVARDLAALGVRVVAYDRDPATMESACAEGVVAEPLGTSLTGLSDAEVVIVAVPVSALRDVLRAAPPLPLARLITDAGSTKRSAIMTAEALGIGERFVGSHPMAGDHRSGWAASRRGLFNGAKVYLCRTRQSCEDAVTGAHDLWRALGGSPEEIAPDAHDRLLAYASHLPHAVSAALALTLESAGVTRAALGAGGRDATRLAGGSVEMWTAIARDNADDLLPCLVALEAHLQRLRAALERGDEASLRDLFRTARSWSFRDGADGSR